MPTRGETMPPNEKQTAPNSAEAVPAFVRSHSMANAVEVVNVIPIIKKNRYQQQFINPEAATQSQSGTFE